MHNIKYFFNTSAYDNYTTVPVMNSRLHFRRLTEATRDRAKSILIKNEIYELYVKKSLC